MDRLFCGSNLPRFMNNTVTLKARMPVRVCFENEGLYSQIPIVRNLSAYHIQNNFNCRFASPTYLSKNAETHFLNLGFPPSPRSHIKSHFFVKGSHIHQSCETRYFPEDIRFFRRRRRFCCISSFQVTCTRKQ
jgi:hypothetical protein